MKHYIQTEVNLAIEKFTFFVQSLDFHGIINPHRHHNYKPQCTMSFRPQFYQMLISLLFGHDNNRLLLKYRIFLFLLYFVLHLHDVRPAKITNAIQLKCSLFILDCRFILLGSLYHLHQIVLLILYLVKLLKKHLLYPLPILKN